jgi:hypothetical protein
LITRPVWSTYARCAHEQGHVRVLLDEEQPYVPPAGLISRMISKIFRTISGAKP